jgi:hypothetical protein
LPNGHWPLHSSRVLHFPTLHKLQVVGLLILTADQVHGHLIIEIYNLLYILQLWRVAWGGDSAWALRTHVRTQKLHHQASRSYAKCWESITIFKLKHVKCGTARAVCSTDV